MNTTDRTRPAGSDTIEAAPLRGLSESDRTLLIVDDDAPLCQRLARAMERRGFVVSTAESVSAGTTAATAQAPAFAVVDLRLGDGSGLDVVSAVRTARPGARIVMLMNWFNRRNSPARNPFCLSKKDSMVFLIRSCARFIVSWSMELILRSFVRFSKMKLI